MVEKRPKRWRGHGFSKTQEETRVSFVDGVQEDPSTRLPLSVWWSVGTNRPVSPEIQALFTVWAAVTRHTWEDCYQRWAGATKRDDHRTKV